MMLKTFIANLINATMLKFYAKKVKSLNHMEIT